MVRVSDSSRVGSRSHSVRTSAASNSYARTGLNASAPKSQLVRREQPRPAEQIAGPQCRHGDASFSTTRWYRETVPAADHPETVRGSPCLEDLSVRREGDLPGQGHQPFPVVGRGRAAAGEQWASRTSIAPPQGPMDATAHVVPVYPVTSIGPATTEFVAPGAGWETVRPAASRSGQWLFGPDDLACRRIRCPSVRRAGRRGTGRVRPLWWPRTAGGVRCCCCPRPRRSGCGHAVRGPDAPLP